MAVESQKVVWTELGLLKRVSEAAFSNGAVKG